MLQEGGVDELEHHPGKGNVLADEPGDLSDVRVRHCLFHLQVHHDLGLWWNPDALEDVVDLFVGEFRRHRGLSSCWVAAPSLDQMVAIGCNRLFRAFLYPRRSEPRSRLLPGIAPGSRAGLAPTGTGDPGLASPGGGPCRAGRGPGWWQPGWARFPAAAGRCASHCRSARHPGFPSDRAAIPRAA